MVEEADDDSKAAGVSKSGNVFGEVGSQSESDDELLELVLLVDEAVEASDLEDACDN